MISVTVNWVALGFLCCARRGKEKARACSEGQDRLWGAAAGRGVDNPCQLLAPGWLPMSFAVYFCASVFQLRKGGTCVMLGELLESQAQ